MPQQKKKKNYFRICSLSHHLVYCVLFMCASSFKRWLLEDCYRLHGHWKLFVLEPHTTHIHYWNQRHVPTVHYGKVSLFYVLAKVQKKSAKEEVICDTMCFSDFISLSFSMCILLSLSLMATLAFSCGYPFSTYQLPGTLM